MVLSLSSPAEMHSLEEVARALVAKGKGILAADESPATLARRFEAINVESTPESRRRYRFLLFSTQGLEKFISGAILHEETLRDAKLIAELQKRGILVGCKVDCGLEAIDRQSPHEMQTKGLDGLEERCREFRSLGAVFAKWRAVVSIDAAQGLPSEIAIARTASDLASYASACQSAGLVPIVEPEVLMDGPHDIATSARISELVLAAVYHVRTPADFIVGAGEEGRRSRGDFVEACDGFGGSSIRTAP